MKSELDIQLNLLVQKISDLIDSAKSFAISQINSAQLVTFFVIGHYIVEGEQNGESKAKYGEEIIKNLSLKLNEKYGKGYSKRTLEEARRFYLTYKERITQTVFAQLEDDKKMQTVFAQLREKPPFILSWSHYLQLMRIENSEERRFYEIEASKENWSVRHLQRQYNSSLYERVALSKEKNEVINLSKEGLVVSKPEDIIKQPTVLEFLNLNEDPKYSETDLESAIIDKLQNFLLELGKGYLFEKRQKRFTFNEDNYYVDLVFYNRLLKCYVLIDLKIDKISHQDLGQMQMYVNYYNKFIKLPEENPTIGILLCKEKNDELVELTLPPNANIFASEYKLYLPDKKVLQQKLREWVGKE